MCVQAKEFLPPNFQLWMCKYADTRHAFRCRVQRSLFTEYKTLSGAMITPSLMMGS